MTQQENKVKGVADIVFLIDVTGSMQPCIDALKNNSGVFVETMVNDPQSPIKDWRAKAVGFRDVETDAEYFVDNPFVSKDVAGFKAQLAALNAEGGGDEPESLLDALYKVATMGQTDKGSQSADPTKWRYRSSAARVVVVFSDAPFKETMAIPEAKGGGLADITNTCQQNRIILSIFAPSYPCYDELAMLDKSEYIPVGDPASDRTAGLSEITKNPESFKKTMIQLAKSVSKSAAAEVI